MKGIILAGGSGTRLYPLTMVTSKQLLPVYDKPMIYYPLSVLMLAGIDDILIISTPEHTPLFEQLLGDGSSLGISLSYKIQDKPRGLADAFIQGETFIEDDNVCLILGDNIFYGQDLTRVMNRAKNQIEKEGGSVIFGYQVKDPRAFGVVEFAQDKKVISLEEKPGKPKSNYAIPGLYFYDNNVIEIAKTVEPSDRGEIEITTVNNHYLQESKLSVELLGRGMAWLDTGTPAGLLQAAEYVEAVQTRQGFYVACLEEIAWRRGFIDDQELSAVGKELDKTDYGQYILSLLNEVD